MNRQRFIGLSAYVKGVEYDSFTFTVTTQPNQGRLYGTAPNLYYVPNKNYLGRDSFTYEARNGNSVFSRTVNIWVGSFYTLPLGIPSVPFGVMESNALYVGASYQFGDKVEPYKDAGNGPYTHYVDFNSGSDTNNPYGTAVNPRATIPSNLPAGSVVELHGTNIIAPSGQFVIRGEGTASQPIFIRGGSALTKPLFRRKFVIEGDYIICENLEFDCEDWGGSMPGPVWFWVTSTQVPPYKTFHHVAIRHSLFRDQPDNTAGNPCAVAAGLVAFDPALDTPSLLDEYITVYDIEVRNFSQWNDFSGTTDYCGVLFGPNTRNCWVLDSHIHHVRADAVSVCRCNGSANMVAPHMIFVGRNYLHNCKEQAIDVKNGVDCVLSQNTCHTMRASYSSMGEAITIHNDDSTPLWPASDDIWVLFNSIYDVERGILLNNDGTLPAGRTANSYIIGNTFFDIRNINGNPNSTGMAVLHGQTAQTRIVNNLVRDCTEGFRLGMSNLALPNQCSQVVSNNIVADLNTSSAEHSGSHFYLLPVTIWPFTSITNNLHYQSIGRERFCVSFNLGIEQNFYSVADLRAATPFGGGSVEGNPKFANVGALDFHLGGGSPALGAGTRDWAYDWFRQLYGISIDYYQDGTPRSSRAFDIGPLPGPS